ncbi:NAD-dependent epimerase/dehydratase family protein [Krasilnikovia sp. M28-CT-15]|uniref:NAD-dependent epimerase/dehydratase family protein n=1 Tax=Krasilnikovia sp. M28-CT-15 TaxID=3373540 RepID=UPI00387602A2
MKVVVTGGAGFIGANLCRELAERPGVQQVVALDNLSTGAAENLADINAELVVGSILDRSLLQDVVDGADAVVHLAARPSVPRSVADPVASHEANATGTLYVLEACRRDGIPVVAASSSSVYGPTPELPKHEGMATRPQSPYAAGKLAAESYVLAHGATYGMRTLALRFFNVYGPLQSVGHAYAAVIPAFVDAALRRQPLRVHGDGQQTRDFTYVGSVVRVIADAVERGVHHDRPVNLAFGSRTSLLGLIRKIESIVGYDLETVFEASRPGDVRDSQAADVQLRTLFPGREPMSLDDGLAQTVAWYRAAMRKPESQVSGMVA